MPMTVEQRSQWREANRLLAQFIEREPADPETWVTELTISDEVRAKLKQLIEAHHSQGSPLDQSLAEWLPDTENQSASLSGRRIGDWVLSEPLGSGGMATVYKARRDTDQYDQFAAVKLLNIALVNTKIRDHFDREQRILAALHHPHIAGLLDAGVSEDGTPFIVMEYIDGTRIDQYISDSSMTVRAIVRLFLEVCDAVAFAQQNLVVHRDIKPSNIMVNEHGTAKLLDFGIARLVLEQDEDATSTRAFTPGYAAPEQHSGKPVTTATDVYGLGTVLYELLSGQRAMSRSDSGLSAERNLTGLKQLDPDLRNIVAMAVREESERRYPTAAALAGDLRLWMDNRPVIATPDAPVYRLAKYVRRHRVGVMATVLITVVGLSGIASTLWQARRAQEAAIEATATAQQAQAVQDFLLEMFEGADPWTNKNQPLTADQLLDTALAKLPSSLDEHPSQKASVMLALSQILRNLGRYDEGAEQARGAVALFRQTSQPLMAVQGQNALASILIDTVQHEAVLPILREAVTESGANGITTENVIARGMLAQLFTHLSDLDEQGEVVRGLLADEAQIKGLPDSDELLGIVYATAAEHFENAGDYDEALKASVRAESLFVEFHGQAHPMVADALGYQSTALFFLAEWDKAEAALNKAIEIFESNYPAGHPAVLWSKYQLGRTLLEGGRFQRALSHYEQFYQLCVEVLGEQDPRTTMALTNLGLSLQSVGRIDEAQDALARAVPVMETQFGDHPKVGVAYCRHGSILSQLDNVESADAMFGAGMAILKRSVGTDHPLFARASTLHAEHLLRHGQADAALIELESALPVLESAYGQDSEYIWTTDIHRGMANASLGNTEIAKMQLSSGVQHLQQDRYLSKYQALLESASIALNQISEHVAEN